MGRRACKDFLLEFIHCRTQQQDTEQTVDNGRDTGEQLNCGADDFREGLGRCFCKKTAVRTPMGTPSRIARVVPTMEVKMTYKMP